VPSKLQVADVSTSKTGKHGHAKCHFVGIDIFTGKKYEDLTPSSHNCDVGGVLAWQEATGPWIKLIQLMCCLCVQVPNVSRSEYTLVDITEDGFVSWVGGNWVAAIVSGFHSDLSSTGLGLTGFSPP
jgi:hypothetical protein